MAEYPFLYANLMVLSSIEPELWPIEVLHSGNREFHVSRKIVENIKISIRTTKLVQMISKQIFRPVADCSSLYATGVTCC